MPKMMHSDDQTPIQNFLDLLYLYQLLANTIAQTKEQLLLFCDILLIYALFVVGSGAYSKDFTSIYINGNTNLSTSA